MTDYLNRIVNYAIQSNDKTIRCIDLADDCGKYWINEKCEVISLCFEYPLIMQVYDDGPGYKYIKLHDKKYYLHRLFAFTFNADKQKKIIPIENRSFEVHHMDFNRYNNELSNLCIMQQRKHKTIHNLYNKWNRIGVYEGESSPNGAKIEDIKNKQISNR